MIPKTLLFAVVALTLAGCQLARGGAPELLHAGRFPHHRGRPEDRPRRDRRLVQGRPESGVLIPCLADALRGAVGRYRRESRERLAHRLGRLHTGRMALMLV